MVTEAERFEGIIDTAERRVVRDLALRMICQE